MRRMTSKAATFLFGVVALGWFGVATPAGTQADLGSTYGNGRVITGVTPHRIVHFTFDDGPDPRTTPRLLERLDAHGIKATFFFSASRFESRARRNAGVAELAREIQARGHSIGSHSVDHVRMRGLSPSQQREQLDRGDALFRQVFGASPVLFRPPYGSRGASLDAQLAERGMTTVMWNLGVADWVARPPQAILKTWQRVLERAETRGERGGVVLLHDTHAWTADALDLIMADLAQRNCARLGESTAELYDVVPTLTPFFQPRELAPVASDTLPAVVHAETLGARQRELRGSWAQRCNTTGTPGLAKASAPPQK